MEFQLQHQSLDSLLLWRYSKANRSGENRFFAILTDPKTGEGTAWQAMWGSTRVSQKTEGVGNLGRSPSCGLYGKEQVMQGKPPWDGLL